MMIIAITYSASLSSHNIVSHSGMFIPLHQALPQPFVQDMASNDNDDNNNKNNNHHQNHRWNDSTISKQFATRGFVGPIDVLTLSEARAALEEVQNELAIAAHDLTIPTGNNNINNSNNNNNNSARLKLHLILPTLDSIAHHPVVVDAVQQALQTDDILLWSSDVNVKPPNSCGFFAPHQDSTYAGLSPPSKCLTAWIALSDPVGESEGCLSFYPMSHLYGQIPHVRRSKKDGPSDCHHTDTATTEQKTITPKQQVTTGTADSNHHINDDDSNNNNMLSLGQYISQDDLTKVVREAAASSSSTTPNTMMTCPSPTPVPLRGGQMTLHSFLTIHQSGPNQSLTNNNNDRVGFALRYIDGREVIQTKPVKEMVTWISGTTISTTTEDHHCSNNIEDRFDLEPRLVPSSSQQPTDSDIRRGRLSRLEAIRREEANYFDMGE